MSKELRQGFAHYMDEETKLYKSRFNRALEPVKVMLVNKKYKSTHNEWVKFVDQTKASIIRRPVEYLGGDLPGRQIIINLIEGIFADFLADQTGHPRKSGG